MPEPTSAVQDPSGTARQLLAQARQWTERRLGGTGKLRVVIVLAAVLGLDTADKATISAVAGSLENAFKIGNTDIGLLVSAVSFVGAIATLPIGILVDRVCRKRILLFAIVLWSVATWVSGTATSFVYLLSARICLGAVAAAAAPAVASLTGDFFPAHGRARVYSLILGGELVGTGLGFVLAGLVSSWINWRWAFYCLAMLGLLLVWGVWKYLPEPARGGQGWLRTDNEQPGSSRDDSQRTPPESGTANASHRRSTRPRVRRAGIQPREELVLAEDPTRQSLWWTLRYVMKIPTYVRLIIASALGYYFFSGVRAFVMIYLTHHYGLARSSVSALVVVIGVGALLGLLAGGWIAEALLKRRILTARVIVPGIAAFISALFLAPAILSTNVAFAIVMFTFGSGALAAANPGFDAARLDIMHPRLWGRAESIRTALRQLSEGVAPTLFGFVSASVFGGGEHGLTWTFLLMLISLVAASALAIPARHSYPRDVATAAASVNRSSYNTRG